MMKMPYMMIGRGLLIVLPLILFILFSETFLFLSGELIPISEVAKRNYKDGPPGAYMRMLIDQQTYRYRYEQIRRYRPKTLVLGSSRVQRFRQEMFGPGADFYNAAGTIAGVGDLEVFIHALPEDYAPEILLIGVDSWWLNGRVPDTAINASFAEDIYQDDARLVNAHIYAFQRLIKNLVSRKITPGTIIKIITGDNGGIERYGLLAWTSRGLRNDGSNQFFDRSTPGDYYDRETPPVVERVANGIFQFIPARTVDNERLKRLESALMVLSERGTRIIGYAPPFSQEALRTIISHPVHKSFLDDYRAVINDLFKRNRWFFYDAVNIAQFGFNDMAMEDGFHAMETFHVALLKTMGEDAEVKDLLQIDTDYLGSLLSNPETTLWYPTYNQ
jgi:hypothetical protein